MPPIDPPFPTPRIIDADRLVAMLLQAGTSFNVAVMGRAVLRAGWSMGPRVVPGHLIYALESGHVVGSVSGVRHELKPAGAVWVQPGVEHDFSLGPTGEGSCILYCRFFVGRGAVPYRLAPDALNSEPEPQVCELMSSLIAGPLSDPARDSVRRRSILAASMCHLLDSAARPRPAAERGLRADQRRLAVRFIQDHLSDRLTLADLARHVGLNPAYFTQQFRLSFGVSPRAYITAARIQAAAALLTSSNLSVKQVAAQMGYDDIYFFSKQFKQVMRLSPRRWRATSSH